MNTSFVYVPKNFKKLSRFPILIPEKKDALINLNKYFPAGYEKIYVENNFSINPYIGLISGRATHHGTFYIGHEASISDLFRIISPTQYKKIIESAARDKFHVDKKIFFWKKYLKKTNL